MTTPTDPYVRILKRAVWDGECLLGPVNHADGYVRVWDNDRRTMVSAHRLMYESTVGPIPDGLTIDHLCRRRNCLNTAHMEPVTRRENTLRGIGPSAQHAQKTHCPSGHPYSAENTYLYRGRRYCIACARIRWRARSHREEDNA